MDVGQSRSGRSGRVGSGSTPRQYAALPDRHGGRVGAHHLSRRLRLLGHDARLMPAKYVRAYSKGQKNDFHDAEYLRTSTVSTLRSP